MKFSVSINDRIYIECRIPAADSRPLWEVPHPRSRFQAPLGGDGFQRFQALRGGVVVFEVPLFKHTCVGRRGRDMRKFKETVIHRI